MNRNEYSDNGMWRLVVAIDERRLRAWLRLVDDPMSEIKQVAEVRLDGGGSLLSSIESAVYDNPSLLDDYEADIVISTGETLLVPTEMADDEEFREECFSQFYNCEEEDILSTELGDVTMLYSFCPGLKAFMERTFPGARVNCGLGVLTSRFLNSPTSTDRLYAHIDTDRVSIIAAKGKKLLMASQFEMRSADDALYHIMNVLQTFHLSQQSSELSLSGSKDIRASLVPTLRKYVAYVTSTMEPKLPHCENIPLAAALCMLRKPTKI